MLRPLPYHGLVDARLLPVGGLQFSVRLVIWSGVLISGEGGSDGHAWRTAGGRGAGCGDGGGTLQGPQETYNTCTFSLEHADSQYYMYIHDVCVCVSNNNNYSRGPPLESWR